VSCCLAFNGAGWLSYGILDPHIGSTLQEVKHILESRRREAEADEMTVWLFDVKRNPRVKRGREERERAAKRREEGALDLTIDPVAAVSVRKGFRPDWIDAGAEVLAEEGGKVPSRQQVADRKPEWVLK